MQIRQVLFNLLRNAEEAMPDGGKIRITLTEQPPDRVALTVEDEGMGLDPSVSERVFDPFVTTKQTGTGLGLAVTRQILDSHSGTIRCENRETGGARFIIELPLAAPADRAVSSSSLPIA
jgi:signal transduction histidine kinase